MLETRCDAMCRGVLHCCALRRNAVQHWKQCAPTSGVQNCTPPQEKRVALVMLISVKQQCAFSDRELTLQDIIFGYIFFFFCPVAYYSCVSRFPQWPLAALTCWFIALWSSQLRREVLFSLWLITFEISSSVIAPTRIDWYSMNSQWSRLRLFWSVLAY